MTRTISAVLLSVLAVTAVVIFTPGLGTPGKITLAVFGVATVLWVIAKVDDTLVALGAGLVLVVSGVLPADDFFGALGEPTVWLLICAFVIAAGVSASGLAARATAWLVSRASTVRRLVHLTTAALMLSAFAVPATSGRAALAVPVFLALAKVLEGRRRVIVALALVFPAVILLSAVASLIGAGAHLITVEMLFQATGERIGFAHWLLLGLPLAVVSSHLAAEIVLLMITRRADRREPVSVSAEAVGEATGVRVTGPLDGPQRRSAVLLCVVVALWCAEPLHGVSPAVVAFVGAVLTATPKAGTITMNKALATVPWAMLMFMAATMAMGVAMTRSGAAEWLAGGLFGVRVPAWQFLAAVVGVSTLAHLLLQSRSARSSVLVPLVITAAAGLGVSPSAAAFASTAAAGFCHTLPASAKPVALFHRIEEVPTYGSRHLLALSAVLAPLTAGLVLLFALMVWPLLGLPY
ncbi:SLC13 family permease [Nonomuraea sp. NPDC050790]|uniref:SLC13 family permease n=1 Tax=Nonomuraea sp. NPDC050790 TaxID=3364371 RepID=UPI0037AB7E1E